MKAGDKTIHGRGLRQANLSKLCGKFWNIEAMDYIECISLAGLSIPCGAGHEQIKPHPATFANSCVNYLIR